MSKKEASVITDQTPAVNFYGRKTVDRAVFEKGGRVHILTLTGSNGDESQLIDIEGASLRHVLAFEKQQNSLDNSNYVNRLD